MKTLIKGGLNLMSAIIAYALLSFLFSSCSQTTTFQTSSVVPAAHGKVKMKKDNNGNYKIDVNVTNLAEVENVYSRNHTYMVWMETRDGDIRKLGQLVSTKKLFSKERDAELSTISLEEPDRIFITAERNADSPYPGNKMILRTADF